MLSKIKTYLSLHADPQRAQQLTRYFKTGPGQYAEGDQFIGINSPTLRQIAKQWFHLPLSDLSNLISSPINEERSLALMILIQQYSQTMRKGSSNKTKERESIYQFYLNSLSYINNWNLVDMSAPHIIGCHIFNQDKPKGNEEDKEEDNILYQLVQSDNIWHRRIAIVATLYFIKKQQFLPTIKLATHLINDSHDLIHKASGWMLREVGKYHQPTLHEFLAKHQHSMPRTMLRYAIEKFPPEERSKYIKAKANKLLNKR